MSDVALYTAVYGAYERQVWPAKVDCPAFFYTDSEVLADEAATKGWEPRIVRHSVATLNGAPSVTEPMLNHKYWKTHPAEACPDVDISLWIDGSMEICVGNFVERCLQALGEDDWACTPHPERNCVFLEADYSAVLTWRYDADSMIRQRDHYRSLGHPDNWNLFATGANARRHTPAVIELGEHWWMDNLNWSHQDQLSFPVLLRIFGERVKWNRNLPWHESWNLRPHGY